MGFKMPGKWFSLLCIATTATLSSSSLAFEWPGASPWPSSSVQPVRPLPNPTLDSRLNELGPALDGGFRLVVFGDQRALADGEWQSVVAGIVDHENLAADSLPLLAILDTGDIVQNGSHTDQFGMLADILKPLRNFPYLVAPGNHELNDNKNVRSRLNAVIALSGSMPWVAADSLWYEYSMPHARLIILDTNDLVYGPTGQGSDPAEQPRVKRQLLWLESVLARPDTRPILVAMHHPFISSSKKHRKSAIDLWSFRWHGRTLPEILADGGVDLIFVGHTHTFERFRLKSPKGSVVHLVNLSGRPRDSFFWWGAGARRAQDWRNNALQHLGDSGWKDLEGWEIDQESVMLDENENQWADLQVYSDGRIDLETFFLVDKGRSGYRSGNFAIIAEGTKEVR